MNQLYHAMWSPTTLNVKTIKTLLQGKSDLANKFAVTVQPESYKFENHSSIS